MEKKKSAKKVSKKKPELTEKQKLFCLYYIKNFNATQAYLKAYKCGYDEAHANSYRMMANDGIRKEISRLKKEKQKSIMISKDDILERYMRIAFADMTDFVEWKNEEVTEMTMCGEVKGRANIIKFKDSSMVDGGLVCQITQSKNGSSIKLEDRQKALEWLAGYFDMNPMDKHRKTFDNKKLELEQEKWEIEKASKDPNEVTEDDGFIEALNACTKEVWSDETDSEKDSYEDEEGSV